jgi:2-aminophenol/2-amino-5-chlorophenol 1,6-dioxygenase alpha subunit
MDADFAQAHLECAKKRGLTARTVNYHGFPVDTGTVVALKLLNPNNEIPACVVSCNMYADRAETIVFGKSALDSVKQTGKRVVAIAVTALSNRMWTSWIDPKEDSIYSPKDDEWNRKLLELLAEGRLEDVSQLARQFTKQAHADQKLKAIWWLSACLGQNNDFAGHVYDYQPIWGSGAALVGLTPDLTKGFGLEYDEDNTETYKGDRNVLSS